MLNKNVEWNEHVELNKIADYKNAICKNDSIFNFLSIVKDFSHNL